MRLEKIARHSHVIGCFAIASAFYADKSQWIRFDFSIYFCNRISHRLFVAVLTIAPDSALDLDSERDRAGDRGREMDKKKSERAVQRQRTRDCV